MRTAWAAVLLAAAGCASQRPAVRPTEPSSPSPLPAPSAPSPRLLAPPPEPVYRNPKIGIVYLRAHLDAQGRLLGPQVMYQITDPGGWNLDALDGGRGFIPAANLEAAPNIGSPYVIPAREVPLLPTDSPLLDPAIAGQVTITGLMAPEDRERAEALARRDGGAGMAVFDQEAGWLVIPRPSPAREHEKAAP